MNALISVSDKTGIVELAHALDVWQAGEGVDRIVFTGGIGANAAFVRQAVCDGLRFLGVDLDAEANLANASSVHTSHSAIKVNVLQTDEESILARKAAAHLDGSGSHETKGP